jgi:hypothetical protein
MAFGRRKAGKQSSSVDPYAHIGQPESVAVPVHRSVRGGTKSLGSGEGPYDLTELDDETGLLDGRLDLGSLVVAMPDQAQLQVEMSPEGTPVGVHIDTPFGRISPGVFAAPKSPGQWREVVTEISDSLRESGAQVTIEDGHWGREVVGRHQQGTVRFLGVDGPRWMIRFVVTAPDELADQAAQVGRTMLAETVVRRGNEPRPARDHLDVELPAELIQQLQQAMVAQQQQAAMSVASQVAQNAAAQEAAQQAAAALAQRPPLSDHDRRTQGSAISRLGRED